MNAFWLVLPFLGMVLGFTIADKEKGGIIFISLLILLDVALGSFLTYGQLAGWTK